MRGHAEVYIESLDSSNVGLDESLEVLVALIKVIVGEDMIKETCGHKRLGQATVVGEGKTAPDGSRRGSKAQAWAAVTAPRNMERTRL